MTVECIYCLTPVDATAEACPSCKKNPHAAAPRESASTATKRCPFCAEEILAAAVVCKHCRRDLLPNVSSQVASSSAPSPGVAAVLSLVIPGAGQMYTGNVGTGIAWLLFTAVGYVAFILPGLILHIVCILSAADSARKAQPAV